MMHDKPMPSATSQQAVDTLELITLRAIVECTAQATGEEFFRLLVQNLSIATGGTNAFIAEFAETNTRVRTLAYWVEGQLVENDEWDLENTPCQAVLAGNLCHFPTAVWEQFPDSDGVESYLGVPLQDTNGDILGHLAIYDHRPMPAEPRLMFIFQIFAARATAEICRLRANERLLHSEARLRDLFEEAPVAYVHEGLDLKFISANRAAQRILGLTPEQIPGFVGASLVPNTPEAQARLQEAFKAMGRGTDTEGVVLELQRYDTGKPIWIQWWSVPNPNGQSTRTMFIDITTRILMEQEQARLQAENWYLQEEIKASNNFDEIVGRSSAIESLLKQVQRVAVTDASVLIQGESGTGKELIARAIHSASKRHAHPLIKVNCAALPAGLIESELFGHEKGAFTGAIAKRIGRFELAHGGTIFLDEVGEIPLDVQVKLLRVLQEREFERVGGHSPIKVDVRVIAATNRNLLQEIAEKNFRADLFYRLNVFPLTTPPLRERRDDIPLLAYFMLDKFGARLGKRMTSVSHTAMQRLQTYSWPGNIRELENVIERAIILADGAVLEVEPEMLAEKRSETLSPAPQAISSSLEDIERQHIKAVLAQCHWVIEGSKGAAKMLNMQPSTLRYRMKKLGLEKNQSTI